MDTGTPGSPDGWRRIFFTVFDASAFVTRLRRTWQAVIDRRTPRNRAHQPSSPRPATGSIIRPTQFIGVLPPDIFEERAR